MKKSIRENLPYFRILRVVWHTLLIFLSFYIMYQLRFHTDLIPWVQLRIPYISFLETALFVMMSVAIFVFLWIINWLYELFKPIQGYYRTFFRVSFVWIICISFISYYGYWFVFVNGISRFILLIGACLAVLMMTIFDSIFNGINSAFERKSPYKILFLYEDASYYQSIIEYFKHYRIYEIKWEEIDSKSDISFLLKDYDIVTIIWSIDIDQMQYLADICTIAGKKLYHISENFFLEDLIYNPDRLWPILAFEYKPSPLDGWNRVFKRAFDIVSSLILLILLSPLFLLIALIQKLHTPWPVLYVQKRVGRNGKLFNFIKFRSMYSHLSTGDKYGGKEAEQMYEELINSDANTRKWPLAKIEWDPRVTPFGRFLRKTSLDELPQLFSVLIGDMSLVWPRPHMESEVKKYSAWHTRLLRLKPWITWYAQIFGRDKLNFDQEAKLDLYYTQNRSLFLDLYVLLSTLNVVFRGK